MIVDSQGAGHILNDDETSATGAATVGGGGPKAADTPKLSATSGRDHAMATAFDPARGPASDAPAAPKSFAASSSRRRKRPV